MKTLSRLFILLGLSALSGSALAPAGGFRVMESGGSFFFSGLTGTLLAPVFYFLRSNRGRALGISAIGDLLEARVWRKAEAG